MITCDKIETNEEQKSSAPNSDKVFIDHACPSLSRELSGMSLFVIQGVIPAAYIYEMVVLRAVVIFGLLFLKY